MPETDVALAVQVRQAAADVGAQHHLADVHDPDRGAVGARCHRDLLEVLHGLDVAAAADAVFGPAELDQAARGLVVARAHRLDDLVDRKPVGLQPVRVDVDLVLLAEPADRRHLRHPGHRLEIVLEVPVLIRAQLGQAVLAGLVHQRVLVDPAERGRVRAELGPHALGQARQHGREVLLGARARPVDVGAVLEDDVDVGVAEVREAAHGLDLGGAHQGRDDRVGDLVLDQVRALVPAREDDHLRVAQVRDRVQRDVPQRPPAGDAADGGQRQHEELVGDAEIDDAVDHGRRPTCERGPWFQTGLRHADRLRKLRLPAFSA